MAIVPSENPLEVTIPKPLEFLTKDYVHPENARIIEEQQRTYRLLTWWDRWRMRRKVARLRRQLKHYNRLITQHSRLVEEAQALKTRFEAETDPAIRQRLAASGRSVMVRGRATRDELVRLMPLYSDYKHFSGWLEYERKNRAELKARQKEERQINRAMRKEAKDIARIVRREWEGTHGCHYMKPMKDGNYKAIAPKIFKTQTGSDAHYLWIKTRTKTLFGYRRALPHEVDIEALQDEKRIIQNCKGALNREVTALWTQQGQFMYRVSRLDSPDALPSRVMWRDSWEYYPENRHDYLPYTVGVEEHRHFKWFDFGTDPHILIGGTTGSGKSNQVNGMIGTWVKTHTPDELRLVLIDQKGGLEFGHWSEVPHLLWNVGKVVDDVIPLLSKVVALLRKRMSILEAAHQKKIEAYNRVATKRMARVVVIIDEMSNLVELGATTDEIHNLIMIITAMGRAVGVHMICATQQPEVKIVPGRLKANMRMRIAGYMPSTSASMTILDIPDATMLKAVPGRIMVVSGMQRLVVQAPYIEDTDISHVIDLAQHDYSNVAEELWEMEDVARADVWNEDRVIQAALDLNNGSLSGSALHKLYGDESPGERLLRTLCKRVIDRGRAQGGYVEHAGARYKFKRMTSGWSLVFVSKLDKLDELDELDVVGTADASVQLASNSETPERQPLTESAAD